MRDFLLSVLGSYSAPTYTSYVLGTEGVLEAVDVIPSGLAGVDWSFILTGLFFLVVVYSFFKILGGLLCRAF